MGIEKQHWRGTIIGAIVGLVSVGVVALTGQLMGTQSYQAERGTISEKLRSLEAGQAEQTEDIKALRSDIKDVTKAIQAQTIADAQWRAQMAEERARR